MSHLTKFDLKLIESDVLLWWHCGFLLISLKHLEHHIRLLHRPTKQRHLVLPLLLLEHGQVLLPDFLHQLHPLQLLQCVALLHLVLHDHGVLQYGKVNIKSSTSTDRTTVTTQYWQCVKLMLGKCKVRRALSSDVIE